MSSITATRAAPSQREEPSLDWKNWELRGPPKERRANLLKEGGTTERTPTSRGPPTNRWSIAPVAPRLRGGVSHGVLREGRTPPLTRIVWVKLRPLTPIWRIPKGDLFLFCGYQCPFSRVSPHDFSSRVVSTFSGFSSRPLPLSGGK